MRSEGQIPFDLVPENSIGREDLIESPANLTAINMIDAWPDWPGPVTVLAGPVGSGKSHISSVWSSITGARRVFSKNLAKELEGLVHAAEVGACVLVEDASKETLDETALFHMINAVRQGGGHCLITSRSWPTEWNITLPDLMSRMKAAQLIELSEPDDMLLKLVMMKLFSDRQLMVDEKVLDYCVVRMERSLQSAALLVSAIDAEALARKSPITRATAAAALEKQGMN